MPNLPLLSGAYGGRPNMVAAEPQSIYGYQIRKPFAGEDNHPIYHVRYGHEEEIIL